MFNLNTNAHKTHKIIAQLPEKRKGNLARESQSQSNKQEEHP